MKRTEFTKLVVALLTRMIQDGYHPIIDYVKRSTEEQGNLYDRGVSKCDGIKKISKHQRGKAVDIYLVDDKGKLIDWETIPEVATIYHSIWASWGGRKIISWDKGHFE